MNRKRISAMLVLFFALCFVFPFSAKAAVKINIKDRHINAKGSFQVTLTSTSEDIRKAKWTSSNTRVAKLTKVSAAKKKVVYKVTGAGKGDCNITATYKSKKYICKTHVDNPSLKTSATVQTETPQVLTVSGLTSTAKVTWTNSNGSALKITPKNTYAQSVTMKGLKNNGTARLTAKVNGKNLVCNVKVTHVCSKHPSGWETRRNATCMIEGERIKTCTICGKTISTETIEKKAHDFSGSSTVEVGEDKYNGYYLTINAKCKNCGYRMSKRKITLMMEVEKRIVIHPNTKSRMALTTILERNYGPDFVKQENFDITSSDESVAVAVSDEKNPNRIAVQGKKEGKATITVSYKFGDKLYTIAQCNVEVTTKGEVDAKITKNGIAGKESGLDYSKYPFRIVVYDPDVASMADMMYRAEGRTTTNAGEKVSTNGILYETIKTANQDGMIVFDNLPLVEGTGRRKTDCWIAPAWTTTPTQSFHGIITTDGMLCNAKFDLK